MPSEPPIWRKLFSTPEPTPALSTGTAPIAAAVIGDIVSAIPTPPSSIDGRSVQNVELEPDPLVEQQRDAERWSCRRPSASASRSGRTAFPAIGATMMIRIVIGRKTAPACIGE